VVSFAGIVAGTVYVVVRHADGWRATYGNVDRTRVGAGDTVVAGSVVGLTAGSFHFGLRDGDRYIDPAPYLGTPRGVVRLVPDDGSPAAPAPPPQLRCTTNPP
jgi:murein DD-endopeptidase MepM/ murein hydrolase activator NlpD